MPARDDVLAGPVRISPGTGTGDDLDGRVDLEEIIGLVLSSGLGVWLLGGGIVRPDLRITAVGTAFLASALLIIRHLRSRVVLDATGIAVRRVFRRNVTIPWSTVESVAVVAGPWAPLNETSSVCIVASGSRHWIVQIRRPTNVERQNLSTDDQRALWLSVDQFASDLAQLATDLAGAR